jgi:hypothetical protein
MCGQVATGAQCDWMRHSADPTRSVAAETLEGAVIPRGATTRNYFPTPEHLPPNTAPDFWVFGMTVRVSLKVSRLVDNATCLIQCMGDRVV